MAKTTETVEVVFTADTQQYDQQVIESTNITNNFNLNIGKVVSVSILAGASLLKLNLAVKLLSGSFLLGLSNITLVKKAINFTTAAINKLIPATVRLRAALIATGIGAILIAFVTFVEVLNNTVGGTQALQVVWKTLGNVWNGIIETLTGLAKILAGIISLDSTLIVEGYSQAWEGVADGIGDAVSNAQQLVMVQNQLLVVLSTATKAQAEYRIQLDHINNALKVEALTVEATNVLLRQKAKLENQLINDKLTQNALGLNALQQELKTKTGRLERLKLETSINKLEADRIKLLNQRGLIQNELARISADKINEVSALEAEAARLAQQAIDDKFVAEVTAANELTALQKFQLSIRQQNKALNDVEEAEFTKVVQDELDADLLLKQETRLAKSTALELKAAKMVAVHKINQEQSFENFKANAMGQGFALAGQLAKDNQQLRGTIMIAEALANTALGISRAPADYGAGAAIAIPIIAALGAAQIAVIAREMGASGGSVSTPSAPTRQEQTQVETAFGDVQSRPQVVLVTEDLNAVQSRVRVTEDKASLGG